MEYINILMIYCFNNIKFNRNENNSILEVPIISK